MREAEYLHETSDEHRKAYGQFFTPPRVARLMAQWVLQGHPQTILITKNANQDRQGDRTCS